MKGKLRKKSVHASPCAGSVKDFIVCFFFVFIVPSLNIYKTKSEGVKHHRTNARIYTLYSTIYRAIYSHRAHDMDESPEDHQGHIKQLYCTLFPALRPLRTLIHSSAPHKENKGVTRPLCYQAALMSLPRTHLTAHRHKKALFLEVLYCLICGHWATRSLPVTAGSPLRLFSPVTFVIFRTPRRMCPVLSACVRVFVL